MDLYMDSYMDPHMDSWVLGDFHMQPRLQTTALGQDEEDRALSYWSQSLQEHVIRGFQKELARYRKLDDLLSCCCGEIKPKSCVPGGVCK